MVLVTTRDTEGELVELEVDEAEAERALRGVRVYTFQSGWAVGISDDHEADHPELRAIGCLPHLAYSRWRAELPTHPLIPEGFGSEREWRIPSALIDVCRKVAEEQYAARVEAGRCLGRRG